MIPEGHTIEDIKKREQIIRDFYREWKEKKSFADAQDDMVTLRMTPKSCKYNKYPGPRP